LKRRKPTLGLYRTSSSCLVLSDLTPSTLGQVHYSGPDVQVQARAKALHECHGAAASSVRTRHVGTRCPSPVALLDRVGEDSRERTQRRQIEGSECSKLERQREHSLANGHTRKNAIDEVRGSVRHPPPRAARTYPPKLAREGDKQFMIARLAACTHEGGRKPRIGGTHGTRPRRSVEAVRRRYRVHVRGFSEVSPSYGDALCTGYAARDARVRAPGLGSSRLPRAEHRERFRQPSAVERLRAHARVHRSAWTASKIR
jgi:hypothetical protein